MLQIKPNELKAISLAASTEETRYYLKGVFIEQYESGEISLAATDGYRLHVLNYKNREEVIDSFILSSTDIKRIDGLVKIAQKAVGRNQAASVVVFIDKPSRDHCTLEISIGLVDGEKSSFRCDPIDGTFPDYRRIVPSRDREEQGSPQCFNAVYLADFGEAAKLLKPDNKSQQIVIHPAEDAGSPAFVTLNQNPEFLGVIMPILRN